MTDKPFRPMLAVKAPDTIRFPVFGSPKIDGIRAIVRDKIVYSRSLKPIPNRYVQKLFGRSEFEGLDGELTVGSPCDFNVMQTTISGVMTEIGTPAVIFNVFDFVTCPAMPYYNRYAILEGTGQEYFNENSMAILLPQTLIETYDELDAFEAECVNRGYEGAIIRSFDGRYKFGRSTAKEQFLLKLKRFDDGEAVVIGLQQMLHNDNEAVTDALGFTRRASHAENKRPSGVLGAFVVRDLVTGQTFNVGTGFTAAQRKEYFDEKYIGEIVKYKHLKVGSKDAPRHPGFLGFRNKLDM